jgi:DNA-binding NarL/FixJ family response regulator
MKTDRTPIKIIIADDHPLCLMGFKKMLRMPEFELIGEAINGKELVELAIKLKPDVILTDIKMPYMDGIEATKILSKGLPDTGIIAMSILDEYSLIMDMIDAGAKGYLLKSASPIDVIAAIHAVNKGETYYCKETTQQMVKMLDKTDNKPILVDLKPELTEREIAIIKSICEGMSNKEIANQFGIRKRTVEWNREEILKKLHARNTAGIIVFAIKNKLC